MKISAYSSGCGALVGDVQLASLTDDNLAELHLALSAYGVLFFREQDLSPDAHLEFANRFGTIVRNKFFAQIDGYPDIAEVRKEKDQKMNIGGGWHTDHSYDAEPALGSILVARELPKQGGDTRFAHLGKAYAGLPSEMKSGLSSLRAVHSNEHIYGADGYYAGTDMAPLLGGANAVGQATHPVIVKHPVSGQDVLYINPGHTIGFEGQTYEDSKPLMDELYAHVDQPDYTCRFDWQPGSVAFWDNRLTWHYAENDYHGERRLMHRITLAGTALAAA